MQKQAKISVGIVASEHLHFFLHTNYKTGGSIIETGGFLAFVLNNQVYLKKDSGEIIKSPTIFLEAENSDSFFELKDVVIGLNFHWEKNENQQFKGSLKLIPEGKKVRAINVVDLEEYLKSVISSEMSATSSMELLKAHAVISRSWLLAQIEKSKKQEVIKPEQSRDFNESDEIIRWYDREDHADFDVCADDHCQRYQGITKIHNENAMTAVAETFGEVLVYDDEICDARFSKCCGGISENFENVWEPVKHPYLVKIVDNTESPAGFQLDFEKETNVEKWIRNSPDAFCNTSDKKILSQVLPDFDQSTTDFFRWKVCYSQEEIASLLKKRSGIDFGQIINLQALKRGESGRIIQLKISGTKKTQIVGKELEIRKWLSPSHLYSSAFVVDLLEFENNIPQQFILRGAGWGHGVGLCQIGAAVMGEKGYSYKAILNHYFQGAELIKRYEKE